MCDPALLSIKRHSRLPSKSYTLPIIISRLFYRTPQQLLHIHINTEITKLGNRYLKLITFIFFAFSSQLGESLGYGNSHTMAAGTV